LGLLTSDSKSFSFEGDIICSVCGFRREVALKVAISLLEVLTVNLIAPDIALLV